MQSEDYLNRANLTNMSQKDGKPLENTEKQWLLQEGKDIFHYLQ